MSISATMGRHRWLICALLFFATTINYIDRQILALLKPMLDGQFHWTNEQFGWINSAFQGAYAASYLAFGALVDKYGTKVGYAVSITFWSLAAAGHALVHSVGGFGLARIGLGLGEGGNFPASIKTVAQWFPKKERAFATTLFNSGANVGPLITPAIIPPLALAVGWRGTFLAAGAVGLVWLVAWLVLFEIPRRTAGLKPAELDYIESDGDCGTEDNVQPLRWRELIGYRQTWAFLVAKLLTDPVWWFFLIWLPDYFKKNRGLDLKTIGLPLVAIYGLVTVLSITGGWAGKRLADRGWSHNRVRKTSLAFFAVAVVPVVLATRMPLWGAIAVIGLAGGAHQAWSAALYTTVSDVFPRRAIASVIGLGGTLGSIGGMLFPVICGRVLDRLGGDGYVILFAYCGLAYLLAFALNSLLCPRFEPMVDKSASLRVGVPTAPGRG